MAERLDQLDHQFAAMASVFGAVGGDHALADAPGGLDLHVGVVGEQSGEPDDLFDGEEPAPVCRVRREV